MLGQGELSEITSKCAGSVCGTKGGSVVTVVTFWNLTQQRVSVQDKFRIVFIWIFQTPATFSTPRFRFLVLGPDVILSFIYKVCLISATQLETE